VEIFPQNRDRSEHAWRGWLERLVASGLCGCDQAAALERWPRVLTPLTTDLPWPADAMIESLTRPPEQLSSVQLGINHFKLVLEPGGRLLAKVYLSLVHVWTGGAPVATSTE
jgi:hypothetical protein